jgi:hypothetical protein
VPVFLSHFDFLLSFFGPSSTTLDDNRLITVLEKVEKEKTTIVVLAVERNSCSTMYRPLASSWRIARRSYFTNGKVTKSNDPFAILGLEWGDGASSADIKAAFRRKAQLLHPDVNKTDTPEQAIQQFQKLQKAYETLTKSVTTGQDDLDLEEWRVAIWRQGDRIALDRDDVAGIKRKRPIQPASTKIYGRELGHPGGRGNKVKGEFLGEGKRASSVGTGRSKWVQPKEFKPWDPKEHNFVKASDVGVGKGK